MDVYNASTMGAPTQKLLDWTTNALVSLYFAIPEIDSDGSFRQLFR